MILRLFISLVPEFSPERPGSKKGQATTQSEQDGSSQMDTSPVPQEIASVIREFMSTEVLQACVTSFHEPYFVELQKELASLIAAITVYYSPITPTPRNVLLSLPNVNPADLDRLGAYAANPGSHTRQQRAIVLEMLKDLKGVSVSEMGKLPKGTGFGNSSRGKKGHRTKMAQAFMDGPADAPREMNGARGATPDALDSVANLFGGG